MASDGSEGKFGSVKLEKKKSIIRRFTLGFEESPRRQVTKLVRGKMR